MSSVTALACNTQREVYNLPKLIMRNFPSIANELVFNEEGTVGESVGDALFIKKFELVRYTEIFWNQTIDGVCFQHFSVKTLTGRVEFLELSTRPVFNVSEKMRCGDRLDHIFVWDKSDTYWKYVKEKGFRIKRYFQWEICLIRG